MKSRKLSFCFGKLSLPGDRTERPYGGSSNAGSIPGTARPLGKTV